MVTPLFIFDKATCDNCILWLYDSENHDTERKALLDLYVKSASYKSDMKKALIIIPDLLADSLLKDYSDGENRGFFLDCFIGAVDTKLVDECNITEATFTLAAIENTKISRPLHIVCSDTYVYNEMIKRGYPAITLSQLPSTLAIYTL